MLRVRMKIHITGYRDGEPWPQIGGELDLPDQEAADLEANGYAEIIGDATGDPADDGLDGLSVRKLRQLARDAKVDVSKNADKPELVAALRAAQGGTDGGPDSTPPGDPGGSTPGAGRSDGPPTGKTTPATGDPGASTGTGD